MRRKGFPSMSALSEYLSALLLFAKEHIKSCETEAELRHVAAFYRNHFRALHREIWNHGRVV